MIEVRPVYCIMDKKEQYKNISNNSSQSDKENTEFVESLIDELTTDNSDPLLVSSILKEVFGIRNNNVLDILWNRYDSISTDIKNLVYQDKDISDNIIYKHNIIFDIIMDYRTKTPGDL